ncbi:U-box domain-containing protein 35-like isoform X1 [Solanum stenotomum]|uniref:U-box domain-containing protein 35-like isoform X1 n=1 Tax=Solanum stenotomum TaxID=172797 RepID=UPI0020D1F0AE|nr:U-box domain-containing protein 35-like isoform X1 [Solanum stenotomum]
MSQRSFTGDQNKATVVAIDKDKGSQYALKWAVDTLIGKGKSVTLLHVKVRPSVSLPNADVSDGTPRVYRSDPDTQAKELFLPFRCFCNRKNIQVNEVVIEGIDIATSISDYVTANVIENLVVGAASRNGFVSRFKTMDVPTAVSKVIPGFCTVYVIAKGKVQSTKNASSPVPSSPTPVQQNHSTSSLGAKLGFADTRYAQISSDTKGLFFHLQHIALISVIKQLNTVRTGLTCPISTGSVTDIRSPYASRSSADDLDSIKSPFNRGKGINRSYGDLSVAESDLSFVSSGRPSSTFPISMDSSHDLGLPPRLSNSSDTDAKYSAPRLSNGSETESRLSFGSSFSATRLSEANGFSSNSFDSGNGSWSSPSNMEDIEAEMRRLKQELKQTMDMYSSACKEALSAKHKAMELHRWKVEEEQKLEEARLAEEAALAVAEKEKAKCRAALEAAEEAQRIAEREAQRRISAERKALKESEEKKKVLDALAQSDCRYRKYTIEEIETATDNFAATRKIGEGGYGPVYKCYLDHTQVAIKVLRPDAAQGRSQFQQEVEVLSCIRHPNMVLLLGACPEFGCLVYEYMANGSLDDRLFRRGSTQVLPWQLRFRIAAEVGTSLLFLHQTKPEPLVHRDLKPGNILLDRNYVSKISDVGLARLVPPSIADSVTQYRMTSTAGTFCYIDPEYQQTGMLGTKSDIYSFGIMLLQIITARPPMGLTHHVERAIEKGTFADMLDPAVPDWPMEEALTFAKLALKCAELRRKDRPDLGTVILPELNRLRVLAEEAMQPMHFGSSPRSPTTESRSTSQVSDIRTSL